MNREAPPPATCERLAEPVYRRRSLGPFVAVLLLALSLSCLLSLTLGAKTLSVAELWEIWVGRGSAGDSKIVFELRMDRTLNGLLAGAALGASGAILQSVIRNPIADPGILGINAGAALGVAAGISLTGGLGLVAGVGFALLGSALVALVLFICAALPAFRQSPVRLALCGVALAALLAGVTNLLVLSDEKLLDQFRFWQVGSLAARPAEAASWIAPWLIGGLCLAGLVARRLNVLDLGDDAATAMGAGAPRTRLLGLGAVAMLCGPATALVGPIAFVGFLVPHLVRLWIGNNSARVLGLSILIGPIFLLGCDILGRLIGFGAEIQVGVITGVVGALSLMGMLLRPRAVVVK
ncbi:FecCD family ABC transporter permease [Glutamicibacter sp. X7]